MKVCVTCSAVLVLLASVAIVSAQEEIVGDWRGTLEVPGGTLPVGD